MKSALFIALVASLAVTTSVGQRPSPGSSRPVRPDQAGPPIPQPGDQGRPPPGDFRPPRGDQGPPPGPGNKPPPRPPTRADREREKYLDAATADERAAFDAASPSARTAMMDAWRERRQQREEQAFLAALPQQVRSELDAITDPVVRRTRILALRIEFALDRAIEEARTSGISNDEEVTRIRGLPLVGKADATLDLQKRTLLVRLKPELDRMPRHVRDELSRLSPRAFFEHPAIDDLRNFRFFTSLEREQLRKLAPEIREAVAVAIETAGSHEAMAKVFLPDRLKLLSALGEQPRKRLAREIRDRLDRGPGPTSRPGFHLPSRLFDRLTPEERDVYLNLPDPARHDFAVRRFGPDALRDARGGPDDPPPPPRGGPPPPRGPDGPRRDREPRPPREGGGR